MLFSLMLSCRKEWGWAELSLRTETIRKDLRSECFLDINEKRFPFWERDGKEQSWDHCILRGPLSPGLHQHLFPSYLTHQWDLFHSLCFSSSKCRHAFGCLPLGCCRLWSFSWAVAFECMQWRITDAPPGRSQFPNTTTYNLCWNQDRGQLLE